MRNLRLSCPLRMWADFPMDSIHRFPVSTWKRIWNQRGKRVVNCIVSGRYLRFGKVGKPSAGYFPDHGKVGTPVVLDVMTDTDSDAPDRKLCEMIVTLEELEAIVDLLKREPSDG